MEYLKNIIMTLVSAEFSFFNNLFAITANGLNWGVTCDGVV